MVAVTIENEIILAFECLYYASYHDLTSTVTVILIYTKHFSHSHFYILNLKRSQPI